MTTVTTNFASTTRHDAKSLIQTLLERVRVRAIGAKSYDQTKRELSAMSNRDLADIGLSVGLIEEVASQAAEMAMSKARAVL